MLFLCPPSSPAGQDRDRLCPALDPPLGSEIVHAEKTNNQRIFLPFAAGLTLSDALQSTLA